MTMYNFTHFDVDGAVSHINVRHMLNRAPLTLKCGGYNSVQKFISKLEPGDKVIITDLSLDIESFHYMRRLVGDNYFWMDHHAGSIDAMSLADPKRVMFSHTDAASIITFSKMVDMVELPSDLLRSLGALSQAADGYDMWRTGTPKFDVGYNLNILFWHYNFWKFVSRFKDGLTSFTDTEKIIISDKKAIRDQAFEDSESFDITENGFRSLIMVPADKSIINDVSLKYGKDYHMMFVIAKWPNHVNISVRKGSLPGTDLIQLDHLLPLLNDHPDVTSSGGHAAAGGITCSKDITVDTIEILARALSDSIPPF